MNQHQQAFFIPFGVWMLLGVGLIARVFIITLKSAQAGDQMTRAKEVQKRFTAVGLILMGTLPIAYGVYSFGVQCPDARVAGSFHDLAFCAIVVHEHFHSQEP